jgi:demethylmenaquinone methyltransferase/2-methoxy-6-polyprenyl-1,4-benzoquinol methylase
MARSEISRDISRGTFRVAYERLSRSRLSQCVSFEQADAAALPFCADLFSVIFISFTLELFDTPEIATVLSESRRVLKAGGRICVVAMARGEHENLTQHIYKSPPFE